MMMNTKYIFTMVSLFFMTNYWGQNIGINSSGASPDASAMLDIVATDKGLLLPRVALTGTSDIATISGSEATALIVYNTATVSDVVPGFYYWDGSEWKPITAGNPEAEWAKGSLVGDEDTVIYVVRAKDAGNNVRIYEDGDIDVDRHYMKNKSVIMTDEPNNVSTSLGSFAVGPDVLSANKSSGGFKAGEWNTGVGYQALKANTIGHQNTAVGYLALTAATSGSWNTAIGEGALDALTTGTDNVSVGASANGAVTIGSDNIAIGNNTMGSNVAGSYGIAIGSESQNGLDNSGGAWDNFNVSIGFETLYGSGSAGSMTGNGNVAIGHQSIKDNTSGQRNIGVGYQSLTDNTTGESNTGVGYRTLYVNTSGAFNVALGREALKNNSSGLGNTSLGVYTLQTNTTGTANCAVGYYALNKNTTGTYNVALGAESMYNNTTASYSIGIGDSALYTNRAGSEAIAIGAFSQQYAYSTATGFTSKNSSFGTRALRGSTSAGSNTGNNNTSIGYQSMLSNTTGYDNVALGVDALDVNTTGYENVSIGSGSLAANTDGDNNTALGFAAFATGSSYSNSTAIGANSVINASNKIRLGDASVTVVEGPVAYTTSDKRFKTNISEEVIGLDFIMKLRPVVYNFDGRKFDEFLLQSLSVREREEIMSKKNYEPVTSIRQTGFIAQEVEAAANAVGYDFNGVHVPESEHDNYSVSYSQFVVPLVKAVQELTQKVEELEQDKVAKTNLEIKIQNLEADLNELKKLMK